MLAPICRWHFHHLASWQGQTDRISEPPQWILQKHSVHNGKRRRPHSIPGHWHLQESGWFPRSQSLSEAHPHQSIATLEFTSPFRKQTISPGFPDYRAKALCDKDSLIQEVKFLTTIFNDNGYSPQQIQALKPATQTTKTNERPLDCIQTLHPDILWPTQQNTG